MTIIRIAGGKCGVASREIVPTQAPAALKALTLAIIEAQAREIGSMTAYLDLWYHSTPPTGMGGTPGMGQ